MNGKDKYIQRKRRNRYIEEIGRLVGEKDPVRSVELFVKPHRQPGQALESIAKNLGISEIIQACLPFEGGIFQDGERLVIRINSLSPRVRQRFTLAHEIGHLMLSAALSGKRRCASDQNLEDACNAIAAELLMPAGEAILFVTNSGSPSPENLRAVAHKFDVSLQTAARRINRDLRAWPQSIGLWKLQDGHHDGELTEVWFVGERRWKSRRPPFAAFYKALNSATAIRGRECYFEDEMKLLAFEVLGIGRGCVLGLVAGKEEEMAYTKFIPGDRARANEKAPGDYEGREGTVLRHLPKTSEYEVQFDGDQRGAGWVFSWWLDRIPPRTTLLAQLGRKG